MITGLQIRAAREAAGLTQEELGHRVGVSLRTVGNWERGSSVPRAKLADIRAVLGVSLDERSNEAQPLTSASDVELLAEIARRFARSTQRVDSSRTGASNEHPVGAADHYGLAAMSGESEGKRSARDYEELGEETQESPRHD